MFTKVILNVRKLKERVKKELHCLKDCAKNVAKNIETALFSESEYSYKKIQTIFL